MMKPARAISLFGLSCILGCGSVSSGSSSPLEEFKSIQDQYFPKLDLRVSANQMAKIPEFAARLSQIADQTRLQLSNGIISSAEQRAEAGLILIYDALMTLNNTHAVMEGHLSLHSLKQARRFAGAKASNNDELIARGQYAISELTSAAALRKDDRRIDSWLVSVKTTLEHIQIGKVANASLAAVLDTIDVRPTFNLWTAILMFRGHDVSSGLFARLVSASKAFVDVSGTGSGPCAVRPQDCGNGIRAPYNLQASVTVLGDVFLRKANQLLQSGEIASGVSLAHYAKGTYELLSKPAYLSETQTWPDRSGIALRQVAMAKLLTAQPMDDVAFIEAEDFRRPYECSSCHGRAAK